VAIILFGIDDGDTEGKILWEGILCCIIGPCAAAAAVITTKLGGNLSSMTTYTFMSNFITALLIPTFFPLIEKSAHITFLTAFWIILQRVVLILVVPLVMGWYVKHHMHRFHRRIISIPDLGFYLWGISLTIVTGTTVKNIVNSHSPVSLLGGIAAVSLLLCILQFAVGKYIGHFFQSTINAGQALGQKNTAFAIWIAYT
jgi:BASS family bile acid:Na+ symporter